MTCRLLIAFGSYCVVSFVSSLRGNEGFMLDLSGFILHILVGKREDDFDHPHVVLPLLGRFKNEIREKLHLMLAASTSKSGIEVRKWVEMLIRVMAAAKRYEGAAFCQPDGEVVESRAINEEFWK